MGNLIGKIAVVTGGGRGIGRAVSLRLAREGAAVAVNYRADRASAESLVSDIVGRGGRATAAPVAGGVVPAAEHARHISLAYGEQSDADRVRLTTTGRLDTLPIPAIYLYGRQDVALPVELGYLQEDRLPNVQFFYPNDCGHQGQTDQPDMFNQVFMEFFRDGQVSRKTADWAGVSTRRPEITQFVAEE